MSSPSVPPPSAIAAVKSWLYWFLAIAALAAVLVVAVFAWIDSRKVPIITFTSSPDTTIAIDVRGAINEPGVVYVQPGDRLIDVVNRAGGLAPNADQSLINMSSLVRDGQMIVLPTQVPPDAVARDGVINVNTATLQELDELPGIGEVLAVRIIAYRETNGPFQTVDDLAKVEGISENLVEKLRPYVRISGDD